jgi:hypothetical protein
LKGILYPEENISFYENIRRSVEKHIFITDHIWLGLFKGSAKQILSRFTWEILQTIIGLLSAHAANLIRDVKKVEFAEGSTILLGGGWRGSVSFGTYILLYPGHTSGAGNMLFMHEFGHTLQSRISGPLYLFKYGIPSLLTDNYSWMEKDANLRSAIYFNSKHNIPLSKWQRSRFSKIAREIINPKWWEYFLLLTGIGIFIIPLINYKKGR